MATSVDAIAAPIVERHGAQLFCPACSHELESWEIHLLKLVECRFCGTQLELGATMPLTAALATR